MRSQSSRTRAPLALVTLAIVLGALELFSCAALRATEGRWLGLDDLAAERERSGAGERIPAPGAAATGGRPLRGGRMLHPYLGYVMDPRLSEPGVERAGLDPLSVELGFPRNREPLLQPPDPTRLLVAVFGGSVADVLSEAGGAALRAALAAAPGLEGREIVLLSAAAPGYKQPQALMTLNYLLALGAHFDVVVNLDGVNEVALPSSELVPLGVAPFYPRGWYTRAADLSPWLRLQSGRVALLEDLRRRSAAVFSAPPLRFSWTAGLLFDRIDHALAARVASAERAMLGAVGRSPQAQGPRLPEDATDPEARIVDVWAQSSLQMARLCDGLGIAYFHFLQPNQYVPGTKPMGEAERRVAWSEDSPVRRSVVESYAALRAAGAELAAQGVAFVDLSDVFQRVHDPVYLDDCCHLNALGNRLLGAAVGRAVAEAPALATVRAAKADAATDTVPGS